MFSQNNFQDFQEGKVALILLLCDCSHGYGCYWIKIDFYHINKFMTISFPPSEPFKIIFYMDLKIPRGLLGKRDAFQGFYEQ